MGVTNYFENLDEALHILEMYRQTHENEELVKKRIFSFNLVCDLQ